MSAVLVALFFAIGVAAWTYTKLYQRSGNNPSVVWPGVAAVAIISFIVFFTILQFVL